MYEAKYNNADSKTVLSPSLPDGANELVRDYAAKPLPAECIRVRPAPRRGRAGIPAGCHWSAGEPGASSGQTASFALVARNTAQIDSRTDIGYTLRPVVDSMQTWGKEYKRLRKLMII